MIVERVVCSEVVIPTVSSSTSRSWRPERAGRRDDVGGATGHRHGQGVEEPVVHRRMTGVGQGPGQHGGVPVRAGRDRGEPVGTVVDGVHRRHDGQQHLGGADVGGRLVATDVLLAGLQGEPVGRPPLGVDRDADQPTGQVSLESGGHRHEARVRAAVEQRHAEPLRGADDHVGPQAAGRLEQGERQQVGGHHGQRVPLVRGSRSPAAGRAPAPRRRGTARARRTARRPAARRRGRPRPPRCPWPRRGCAPRRWSAAARRRRPRTGPLALRLRAAYERHRLGRGGGLVEQRGVGGRAARSGRRPRSGSSAAPRAGPG